MIIKILYMTKPWNDRWGKKKTKWNEKLQRRHQNTDKPLSVQIMYSIRSHIFSCFKKSLLLRLSFIHTLRHHVGGCLCRHLDDKIKFKIFFKHFYDFFFVCILCCVSPGYNLQRKCHYYFFYPFCASNSIFLTSELCHFF